MWKGKDQVFIKTKRAKPTFRMKDLVGMFRQGNILLCAMYMDEVKMVQSCNITHLTISIIESCRTVSTFWSIIALYLVWACFCLFTFLSRLESFNLSGMKCARLLWALRVYWGKSSPLAHLWTWIHKKNIDYEYCEEFMYNIIHIKFSSKEVGTKEMIM